MIKIDRCVCTDRRFAELLDLALRECTDLQGLMERSGAADRCGRCRPYLQRCLETGETVFRELLPDRDPEPPPPGPPATGRVMMSWSGGKDSALALHRLQQDPRYEVVGLLTTMSLEHRRISHHGVREDLLDLQAEALGLPLTKVCFPPAPGLPPTMEAFAKAMGEVLAMAREAGTFLVGHGDINLASLRADRERRLAAVGMAGVFPLWEEDTTALLGAFEDAGFAACITCAEPVLGRDFAGAELGRALIPSLPEGVDPCGENGEYHSFVYRGPIFAQEIAIEKGPVVEREGRFYQELLPA